MTARPYGSWPSPLSPADTAAFGGRFGGVFIAGDRVVWVESRPDQDGRAVVMSSDGVGGPTEVAPAAMISARSRVNEYGGGAAWIDGDPFAGGRVFWVAADSQRLHAASGAGEDDEPLTALPPVVRAWRYAAGVVTPDHEWLVCERELHVDIDGSDLPEAVNDLVAIRTDGRSQVELVGPGVPGGGDFIAAPRLSPDGRTLAWLRWDHPDMPWDAAELWAASFDTSSGIAEVHDARRVAGGAAGGVARGLDRAVSVSLPEWSPDGRLWWCDDSTDWWHLYSAAVPGLPAADSGDTAEPLIPGAQEEVGEPRWVSGGRRYGFTDDGRIVFAASADGFDSLSVLDLTSGERVVAPGPAFTSIESLDVVGHDVAVIGGTGDQPNTVWRVALPSGESVDLRAAAAPLESDWISSPVPVDFDTDDGTRAHALFYAPRSGEFVGPDDELPPLVVRIHGGPTAAARPEFSTSVQFWTTRGFAVVDVNYRGSTGYGRAFRDLLRGTWGLADVQDCLSAARHLGGAGLVDPDRCVIRGGSAGGFTALAALCFQQAWGRAGTFAAGCSLYGVTDLAALAADTHKFESRYLDGLVGPYPEDADVYRDRSPLFHADQFSAPVLLLQGSEDKIVPPSQAEVLVEALARRGVPHAYVLFQGEGHGFLQDSTVIRALGTELSFYGQLLGFTPDGVLPDVELGAADLTQERD